MLKIQDKLPKVKTSVDVEYTLLLRAQKKMKLKGHNFRQIVEAALKEYLGEK